MCPYMVHRSKPSTRVITYFPVVCISHCLASTNPHYTILILSTYTHNSDRDKMSTTSFVPSGNTEGEIPDSTQKRFAFSYTPLILFLLFTPFTIFYFKQMNQDLEYYHPPSLLEHVEYSTKDTIMDEIC